MKDWAEQYRKNGLAVLRLKDSAEGSALDSRGKAAFDPGWSKTTPSSPMPDFLPNNNIGILTGTQSNDVVRLDPEWPKSLPILRLVFPENMHRFGRASARGNAILFRSKGLKSKDYILPHTMKDDTRTPPHGHTLRGITVAQILSTGKQTMAPPSVHPNGETLEWESAPKTWVELAPEIAERRMALFSALCVCVQYWPPPETTRAIAACALSRVLLEAQRTEIKADHERIKRVEELVEGVTTCAGNGERGHGVRHVQDTFDKMAAGEDCAGFPKLLELLGLTERGGMDKTLRDWFGLSRSNDDRVRLASPDHWRSMTVSLNEAEKVLCDDHFQVGPRLVKPLRYEINSGADFDEKGGVKTQAGALVLQPISAARLTETFNERINWLQETWSEKKGITVKPIGCPKWAAHQYMARIGEWRLPVMRGVIEAPTLRRDGTLLDRPGYDKASGLWLDTGGVTFDSVPDNPSMSDAKDALEEFKAAIAQFPFVPDEDGANYSAPSSSRSVALSAMLTGLIRRSLSTAPLHGFTAPTMATGKTLLADCAGILAIGRPPTAMSQGVDEEEDEKRLLGVLLRGDPVVLIDNVKRPIEGDGLCIVLSAGSWSSRILGETRNISVATDVLVMATGNNLRCKGDMEARAIMCALDARMERPETRRFEGDLREWFIAERGWLVPAGLTVLRAYAAAGSPEDMMVEPFSRFEDWDRRVRRALVWLGEPDPIQTRTMVAGRDEVRMELGEVLSGLRGSQMADGGRYSAKEMFTFALTDDDLRTAFEGVCGGGIISPKSIGQYLSKNAGRVIDGYCVRRSARADRVGIHHFWLEKVWNS